MYLQSCALVHFHVGVDHLDERRADLAEIVRRDVRRHADRDAGGAVHEQVRNARRQHDRLLARAVVVRPERDGVLVDLGQDLVADAREPAFRVAHRRGVVAVERPEVARAVDQRIAQRERLRHAHERFVERRVAVRVVVAHHVADDLGALAVLGVGGQVLLPHRVEDAALHGLEAVAHVRQRPRRDDRQRVVQVPDLRRLVQRDRFRAARRRDAGFGLSVEQGRRLGAFRHKQILVRQVRGEWTGGVSTEVRLETCASTHRLSPDRVGTPIPTLTTIGSSARFTLRESPHSESTPPIHSPRT